MHPRPWPAFAWAGASKAFGWGDAWERDRERRRISFPYITRPFLQAAWETENTGKWIYLCMVLSKISPSSWSQSRKPIMRWIASVRERFLLILFCLFSSLRVSPEKWGVGNSVWWVFSNSADDEDDDDEEEEEEKKEVKATPSSVLLLSKPQSLQLGCFSEMSFGAKTNQYSSPHCIRCKCQEIKRGRKKCAKESGWLFIRVTAAALVTLHHRHFFYFFDQTGLRSKSGEWGNKK